MRKQSSNPDSKKVWYRFYFYYDLIIVTLIIIILLLWLLFLLLIKLLFLIIVFTWIQLSKLLLGIFPSMKHIELRINNCKFFMLKILLILLLLLPWLISCISTCEKPSKWNKTSLLQSIYVQLPSSRLCGTIFFLCATFFIVVSVICDILFGMLLINRLFHWILIEV